MMAPSTELSHRTATHSFDDRIDLALSFAVMNEPINYYEKTNIELREHA
jgi:hypothetical protein